MDRLKSYWQNFMTDKPGDTPFKRLFIRFCNPEILVRENDELKARIDLISDQSKALEKIIKQKEEFEKKIPSNTDLLQSFMDLCSTIEMLANAYEQRNELRM